MNDEPTNALERLGREFGWSLDDPHHNIARVTAALSHGGRVLFVQESGEPVRLPPAIVCASSHDAVERAAFDFILLASDRVLEIDRRTLVFRPKSLVLGVGCRRGIPFEHVERAVLETLRDAGLSPISLHSLATLESKRGEPAILALAERHRLPIRFFSAEMLAAVSGSERGSTLVEHHVRSRGVCEPAALLAAGAPELLVAKTIADSHALTLAIARIPFTSRAVTP